MKKVILIIAVLTISFSVKAQTTEKEPKTDSKMEYSYIWGLFQSKDYPKGQSVVIEVEKPEFSTLLSEPAVDSTKYEEKSIFWGAIQWTEKKKNTSPVNAQSDGQ